MKLVIRLTVLLILLFSVQAVFSAVVFFTHPRSVEIPASGLSELPLAFGDWICPDQGEPDEDAEVLGEAVASVHRVYHNTQQQAAVSVYMAIWTDYENRLPHPPETCYPASGHKILASDPIDLKGRDDGRRDALMMHIESKQQEGYVLYWYQLDEHLMWNNGQSREVVWSFRGRKEWPPLLKVMLDIRGVDEATARRLLVDLGEQILRWTSTDYRLPHQPAA